MGQLDKPYPLLPANVLCTYVSLCLSCLSPSLTAKLVPLAYGIHTLQISCVVEDDKVGTDFLEESITAFEDLVRKKGREGEERGGKEEGKGERGGGGERREEEGKGGEVGREGVEGRGKGEEGKKGWGGEGRKAGGGGREGGMGRGGKEGGGRREGRR